MSCWVHIRCDLCGDKVPVALEHEGAIEALETHKRALHSDEEKGATQRTHLERGNVPRRLRPHPASESSLQKSI